MTEMNPFALVHLPPGYRVEWVEGSLCLFDLRGEPVLTYPARLSAVLAIEEHAWKHAWGEIESEIRRELRQLRSGTRTVPGLHRMRQYVRLIEALAEAVPGTMVAGTTRRPIPLFSRRSPRLAKLAVAGGLAAAGLLAFLLPSAEPPIPSAAVAPAQGPQAVAPSPPFAAGSGYPRLAAPSSNSDAARDTRLAGQVKPGAGYATIFGRFTSLKAAQICARRVRAKGYLATIVRAGTSFRVFGRTYPTRRHAEQMARIFREIDLPATVQPADSKT